MEKSREPWEGRRIWRSHHSPEFLWCVSSPPPAFPQEEEMTCLWNVTVCTQFPLFQPKMEAREVGSTDSKLCQNSGTLGLCHSLMTCESLGLLPCCSCLLRLILSDCDSRLGSLRVSQWPALPFPGSTQRRRRSRKDVHILEVLGCWTWTLKKN